MASHMLTLSTRNLMLHHLSLISSTITSSIIASMMRWIRILSSKKIMMRVDRSRSRKKKVTRLPSLSIYNCHHRSLSLISRLDSFSPSRRRAWQSQLPERTITFKSLLKKRKKLWSLHMTIRHLAKAIKVRLLHSSRRILIRIKDSSHQQPTAPPLISTTPSTATALQASHPRGRRRRARHL